MIRCTQLRNEYYHPSPSPPLLPFQVNLLAQGSLCEHSYVHGRRKVYKIGGGLPKARIIKFMNFNGGIATDLNFSGCHNMN